MISPKPRLRRTAAVAPPRAKLLVVEFVSMTRRIARPDRCSKRRRLQISPFIREMDRKKIADDGWFAAAGYYFVTAERLEMKAGHRLVGSKPVSLPPQPCWKHDHDGKAHHSKMVSDREPIVYGYCRVSTLTQAPERISLDEQKRRIEGRCLEQSWALAELFVEGGISGSVPFAKRPQGGKLMRRLLPGDIVISPKLVRCFRSALEALSVINDFKQPASTCGSSTWAATARATGSRSSC
jgi:Resolvase, N terminal domain